jgi:hypothetical protein
MRWYRLVNTLDGVPCIEPTLPGEQALLAMKNSEIRRRSTVHYGWKNPYGS